nr:unnamed protein product [Digitaria exilis]
MACRQGCKQASRGVSWTPVVGFTPGRWQGHVQAASLTNGVRRAAVAISPSIGGDGICAEDLEAAAENSIELFKS